MPVCCVFYCKNRSSNKSMRQQLEEKKSRITFHKLPKDNNRRSVWVKAISRIDWTPTSASVICSTHFTEECFDKTSLSVIRIRDTAVPTIFPSNAPEEAGFIHELPVLNITTEERNPPNTTVNETIILNDYVNNVIVEIISSPSTFQEKNILDSPALPVSEEITSENNILNVEAAATSCLPLNTSPCEISPVVAVLRNKLHSMKKRYQRKINSLQQNQRRHKNRIVRLERTLKILKCEKSLLTKQTKVLKSILGSNVEIFY